MVGWILFFTLLLIFLGIGNDIQSGFGNAFGYPSRATGWTIINSIIIFAWGFYILNKIGVVKLWWQ